MQIELSGRKIGPGQPVFIIAEGCDNHLGNLDKAKEMVRKAKEAGADCIKFQHHLPDEEMLPDVPMSSNFNMPLYEFLKRYALTLDQHRELKKYCEEVGILYLCTPFSWKAAEEINTLGVSGFKIGSGEMTDIPSLLRIGGLKKPMIVSTGMCTFDEIERTYMALTDKGVPLALMNCVSEYPPVYEDVNLGVISRMLEKLPKAVIGHSDHTPDLVTSFAAVALGAKIIEKHVILDKKQPGPDQSVSIDFADLAELVKGIRKVEAALGSERKVHDKEKIIRQWAFRSLVTMTPVKAGQTLTQEMVWSKRPGTGIPSHQMNEVIGRKTKKDLEKNVLIQWTDLA